MMEIGSSKVILVEWKDNNILQVWTKEESFHCGVDERGYLLLEEECKELVRYQYWTSNDWVIETQRLYLSDEATRNKVLPKEIENLLNKHFLVEEILYCTVCNCCTYEESLGDNISACGHIRYIESLSEWGGCGYSEHSDIMIEYAKSFKTLLDMILPDTSTLEILSQVYKGFATDDFQSKFEVLEHFTDTIKTKRANGFYPQLSEKEDEIEPAMEWLMSIDPHFNCQDAVHKTNGWLNEAIRQVLKKISE